MLPAGGPRHWYRALIRFMLKVEVSMALALVLGAFGCSKPHGIVLGKSPKGDPVSILAIRAGDTPPQVTISGVMLEKCPVAGCWLKVQDQSGTIMVDTKSAGFVVVNVPLESKVTVAGKIVTEGDEVLIEASGLRY
jgi:hypothetical protein